MDIPTIDDPPMAADPAVSLQYAVRDPDGEVHIYGDQRWVASGKVLRDGSHPDGVIVRRVVTVTYGEWVAKAAHDV